MPGKLKGAHRTNKLSAAFVTQIKVPGRYQDGGGLFLLVDATGAKRWGQRLMVQGKRRDLGLGGFDLVTLAEARKLATANRIITAAKGDPTAAKRAALAVPTFREAAQGYRADKEAEFKNEKTAIQWTNSLETYAMPILGNVRVSEIEVEQIKLVLKPIWETKTETATRVRRRIEAVLSWATANKHRKGDNPARWKGNLSEFLPQPSKVAKAEHYPAVSFDDAPAWFAAVRGRDGNGARALEFAALTAVRSGEVRGARWDEFDMLRSVWIIPAARMKMDKEHRVPLSPEAVSLLKAQPQIEGNDLVFPAPRGGVMSDATLSATMDRIHNAALTEAAKAAGKPLRDGIGGFRDRVTKKPAVPHGLRSLFRDWVAEHTAYPGEMAEVALAHKVGSAVEAAYRRGDQLEKRRQMMADWSRVLLGQTVSPKLNIVPIRGAEVR